MKSTAKKIILTVLTLALLGAAMLAAGAGAETAAGNMTVTEWNDRLLGLQSFKFMPHKDGIGYGDCPVFTAPSEKALRFANNRQACDTDQELYEAGYSEEGWLLVRYDTGNGKTRVGYIPPKYIKGFKSGMSAKHFDRLSAIAADTIAVTDNPLKAGSSFAELKAGEDFVILAKYTYHGNWWYIECTAEGKTARGFIDREKSAFYPGNDVKDNMSREAVSLLTLGTPSRSPIGTEQTGEIMINGNQGDKRKQVHQAADPNSKWVTVVYPANRYPCYGEQTGTDGKSWYYIFVEEDSTWGWLHAGFARPAN